MAVEKVKRCNHQVMIKFRQKQSK